MYFECSDQDPDPPFKKKRIRIWIRQKQPDSDSFLKALGVLVNVPVTWTLISCPVPARKQINKIYIIILFDNLFFESGPKHIRGETLCPPSSPPPQITIYKFCGKMLLFYLFYQFLWLEDKDRGDVDEDAEAGQRRDTSTFFIFLTAPQNETHSCL